MSNQKNISNQEVVANNVDQYKLPDEDPYVGYDWQGEGLYGNEYGYWIENDFVPEEDLIDYIEGRYGSTVAGDIF